MSNIPVIDVGIFYSPEFDPKNPSIEAKKVAKYIYDAFNSWGFLQIIGHKVDQEDVTKSISKFFDLPLEEKMKFNVQNGGVAWRGYMPLGGEGTHGKLDRKEGMYFGYEHPDDHPKIGVPLFGKNQFPDELIPNMRNQVLKYIDEVVKLGTILTGAISISLGLDFYFIRDYFLLPEPLPLCRCFKYPARKEEIHKSSFGIGEHTDFGLLTILKQESAGLQVLSLDEKTWIEVPVIENAFVCNVGDMLDMLTGGRFKSRPHRVVTSETSDRISIPFFFDFSWDAEMKKFPLDHLTPLTENEIKEIEERWNKTTFRGVSGTWSQYLAKKVQKIFPSLKLPDFSSNISSSTRFNLPILLDKEA